MFPPIQNNHACYSFAEQQLQRSEVRLTDFNQEPDDLNDEHGSTEFNNNSQPSPEKKSKKSERIPLSCIYCDRNKTFVYKKSYNNHLKDCHSDQIIECTFNSTCKKSFKTVTDLEQHIISFHKHRKNAIGSNKKKMCIVLLESEHKNEATKHEVIQTCHSIIPNSIEKESIIDKEQLPIISHFVKCIYCKIWLLTMQNLAAHIEQTHSKLKIECNVAGCVTYFLTESDCKAHYDEKHPDVEHSKSEVSEDKLTDSIADIDQIKPFECPECTKSFKSELSFKYHVTFLCTIKRRYAFNEKYLK
jgi:Zinc finger, C2H2 type